MTLEAAEGKQVVWTGGKNSTEPLLRLNDARGFLLKGKNLVLDGEGKFRRWSWSAWVVQACAWTMLNSRASPKRPLK